MHNPQIKTKWHWFPFIVLNNQKIGYDIAWTNEQLKDKSVPWPRGRDKKRVEIFHPNPSDLVFIWKRQPVKSRFTLFKIESLLYIGFLQDSISKVTHNIGLFYPQN